MQRVVGMVIGVCCALLMAVSSVWAQDDVPTWDAYWQYISQAQEAVATAQTTGDLTPLRRSADVLAGITQVELPDGEQIPVSHTYLITLMRSEPPPLEHLAAMFDQMLADRLTTNDEIPIPLPETEQLTEERRRILARPEFQYQPTPIADFMTDAIEELLNLTNRFANPLGTSTRFIIALVGLAIVIIAAVFALRKILESAVREAQYRPDYEEMDVLTSETALARARETSEGGDYRSAVRYLYLSTLLLLEERDLLRYDRTRTNLEYIRSLRGRPEIAAILADVVDVFDRVWYGFQTIDADTYARYAQRVADLQSQR